MKQLQNNFTTNEQSKRLLELGIPVDSADMYYIFNHRFNSWGIPEVYPFDSDPNAIDEYKIKRLTLPSVLPCWSVGRLIEILENCGTDRIESPIWYNYPGKGRTIIERVLWDFENRKLDFSQLED